MSNSVELADAPAKVDGASLWIIHATEAAARSKAVRIGFAGAYAVASLPVLGWTTAICWLVVVASWEILAVPQFDRICLRLRGNIATVSRAALGASGSALFAVFGFLCLSSGSTLSALLGTTWLAGSLTHALVYFGLSPAILTSTLAPILLAALAGSLAAFGARAEAFVAFMAIVGVLTAAASFMVDRRALLSRLSARHTELENARAALSAQAEREAANRALRREIQERTRAEAAIRQLNDDLEMRVMERTRALSRQRAVHEKLLQTGIDAFIVADAEGNIHEWSAQAEQIFGWTASEARQKISIDDLFPADQRPMRAAQRRRFLRSGKFAETRQYFRHSATRRDGSEFPAETYFVPFELEGRWLFGAVARDLSEQQRAEATLRQAQKLEALGQLTGGVAHDFNNALTAIMSSAELLSRLSTIGERQWQLSETIVRAAERSADLTRKLLSYSRKQVLSPTLTSLNDIIVEAFNLIRPVIGADIDIELALDEREPHVSLDASQLSSALINLAMNARDAMPDGGRLHIASSVREAPGDGRAYAVLEITDSGGGMTPSVQQRIFDPFFTTKSAGSGLGLSMVHGFVVQSGGEISVTSRVGNGTSFQLTFPLQHSRNKTQSDPKLEALSSNSRREKRILLVDDDDLARDAIALALTDAGHSVVVACDGASAIEICGNSGPFDVLVTDVVMSGGWSGPQLANEIRRKSPTLGILIISGYTQDKLTRTGPLPEGMVFLQKPFTMREVEKKIASLLPNDSDALARSRASAAA